MTGAPWPSVLLVGPTGSGKTPLGRELERRGWRGRPCAHFDFGANLRAVASAPAASPLGLTGDERAAVRRSLATGALFEDRDMPLVLKVLAGFAAARDVGRTGALLVLNGLPRHAGQATALEGLVRVGLVIALEASAEVVRERLRLDPGGDRGGRVDDAPGAVERRLADYRARTAPLVEHYGSRGARVVTVEVTAAMTAAEAYRELALRAKFC
jgi:adenylate kinase family enzyme